MKNTELFKNIIKGVRTRHDYQGKDEEGKPIYQHLSNYPTVTFRGTVKLHGTNSSIVRYKDGTTEFQSRERVLSLEKDNMGFYSAMKPKDLDWLFEDFDFQDYVAIYGEWIGRGVQSGVALSQLPDKKFVIFAVNVDGTYIELSENLRNEEQNIYNILQFPTNEIDIDFNQPELSQNKLIEMTVKVADCCPVGKYFGVEGLGEGIVFSAVGYPSLKFKSKDDRHSVSKVSKLNAVDTEMIESVNEFTELAVTENRLEQGLSYLKEMGLEAEAKNTGTFIGWVVKDVIKEEADTILHSGLDVKKVKSSVGTKARMWYLNNI